MSETEQTYWNGEPTPAVRCLVRVGRGEANDPYRGSKWWHGLEGTERRAVMVLYGVQRHLLDDEDGSGWAKVTEGHGGPRWPSSSLPDDSTVLRPRYPMPKSVADGIRQAEAGELVDLGSFAQYAPLTFDEVSETNARRCLRWHDADTDAWTGADWSNAMCGEAGEAANVVKKLRRHETRTSPQGDPDEATLRSMLGHEIADTILYALLLADHYSIDVPEAIVEKFNLVSERQGFPERLRG